VSVKLRSSTLLQCRSANLHLIYAAEFVTLVPVPPENSVRNRRKGPPPGETGQESLYLRFLSEKQVPVTVKLRDGEAVHGWIEYFDDRMIRLTREGKPNLFIYKNQIRTITESFRIVEARRRERKRASTEKSETLRDATTSVAVVALPNATQPLLPEVNSIHKRPSGIPGDQESS